MVALFRHGSGQGVPHRFSVHGCVDLFGGELFVSHLMRCVGRGQTRANANMMQRPTTTPLAICRVWERDWNVDAGMTRNMIRAFYELAMPSRVGRQGPLSRSISEFNYRVYSCRGPVSWPCTISTVLFYNIYKEKHRKCYRKTCTDQRMSDMSVSAVAGLGDDDAFRPVQRQHCLFRNC